jgi:hypothetical protein
MHGRDILSGTHAVLITPSTQCESWILFVAISWYIQDLVVLEPFDSYWYRGLAINEWAMNMLGMLTVHGLSLESGLQKTQGHQSSVPHRSMCDLHAQTLVSSHKYLSIASSK